MMTRDEMLFERGRASGGAWVSLGWGVSFVLLDHTLPGVAILACCAACIGVGFVMDSLMRDMDCLRQTADTLLQDLDCD